MAAASRPNLKHIDDRELSDAIGIIEPEPIKPLAMLSESLAQKRTDRNLTQFYNRGSIFDPITSII